MESTGPVRIGVLGGTFNPVHIGHLILAQDAFEQFDLAKVLFMPCAMPPHKAASALAPAEQRLSMLDAALEGDWRFEVSDIEIRRGGVSYTIDTARALKALDPRAELFFIIGGDTLGELRLWKDIGRLLELCDFVTLGRPGTALPGQGASLGLPGDTEARLLSNVRTGHAVEVSSSEIRRRIAEGLSIRYLVHPAVEMYITEHNLYRG